MGGRRFTTKSEYEEHPIPEYVEEHLSESREVLLEAVAETSEDLMESISDEEFTQQEISQALRNNVHDSTIVPVLMGSLMHKAQICCYKQL